jgi:hypothetical protein
MKDMDMKFNQEDNEILMPDKEICTNKDYQ